MSPAMLDIVVLFFLLGVFARLVKSDLRLPEPLYETLSIYLFLAIGLKGGIELSKQPMLDLLPQMLACLALGFAIPWGVTPVLRWLGLSRVDAAYIYNASVLPPLAVWKKQVGEETVFDEFIWKSICRQWEEQP